MVDLKEEIGKRVRQARLNKGLTQADICGDESELTVRQLTRIENGHTLLTILSPRRSFWRLSWVWECRSWSMWRR